MKSFFNKIKYFLMGIIAGLLILNIGSFYKSSESHDEVLFGQHQQFLAEIAPVAQQLQEEFGILPSISIAQASLESDWGQSQLAAEYNNFYGIKTDSDDPDEYVILPTKEFYDNKYHTVDQKFARYSSFQESMREHALLMQDGTTDNQDRYKGVIEADNYQQAADQLVASGYATAPDYANSIKKVIERWNLNRYDQ